MNKGRELIYDPTTYILPEALFLFIGYPTLDSMLLIKCLVVFKHGVTVVT
jgi:hypothetical protein